MDTYQVGCRPRTAAAMHLLMRVAPDPRVVTDPVELADRRTALADARALLCLAHGVPAEDISASGYDLTHRSYRSVRASWIGHIEGHGFNQLFDARALAEAFGYWAQVRPAFTAGDDWLAAGARLHAARFLAGCPRETCDLCPGRGLDGTAPAAVPDAALTVLFDQIDTRLAADTGPDPGGDPPTHPR